MCGIAGSVWWDGRGDVSAVQAMTDALRHRGPDAGDVRVFGPATLGHRRLAIIDCAATANQPMVDPDSGLAIVYNGEIYNFRSVRADLEAEGVVFTTQGDTEVLLKALARWGTDALTRLNGMFAFALWDCARRRLVLARDRLGKKPLFFQLSEQGVIFASELKALRRHPAVSDRLDPRAIGQFLGLNYILGDCCVIRGVEKLRPGHLMVLEPGNGARQQPYWDLASFFREKRRFASLDEAAEEVGGLFDNAVRLRLVSDVPLGAFLSGGLDSAGVTESMSRQSGGAQVRAFTIGFTEPGFDELPQAEDTARSLRVDHHSERIAAEIATGLPEMVRCADEPFADTSMIPVYHLARFARRSVTVALSGDGGDELFAGYITYAADRLHHLSRWFPAAWSASAARLSEHLVPASFGKVGFDYKLRQFLAGHALPPGRAHVWWRTILSADERLALLRPEMRGEAAHDLFQSFQPHFEAVSGCHYLDQAMYADIKTWLVDDILVKVDRMTMAHSLEARSPLLDHRLVELAASLPVNFKLRGLNKKAVFRTLLSRRLPRTLLSRPKAGFSAPVSRWLLGDMYELARAATLGSALGEWIAPRAVETLWDEHRSRRRDHGLKLFGLTCLGLWLEQMADPR